MLGAAEITVMAWVYGADKFKEDLHTMLGFYPFPRIFWLLSWKLVSPALLMVTSLEEFDETTNYKEKVRTLDKSTLLASLTCL